MPLIVSEKVNKDCIWGLWEISESIIDLENLVSAEDLKKSKEFTLEKRKLEYLGSRALIKSLAETINIDYQGTTNNHKGCPELSGTPVQVSISHSGHFATAILDKKKKVGIDIELIQEKIGRVALKFLKNDEISNDIEQLTIFWCVKEAAYKIYAEKNISLRDEINIIEYPENNNGICKAEVKTASYMETFSFRFKRYQDFIIAFNI